MRRLIDCHLHTSLCGHATGTVAEYARAAVDHGLGGFIVTEHLPLPDDLDPSRSLSMAPQDIEGYLDDIASAAASSPELEIVAGIEADWLPERLEDTRSAIAQVVDRPNGVRVVLGSVHFVEGWPFDDPDHIDEWKDRDVDTVWEGYAEAWCSAAQSGLFDVMAHPDLPKKFGHRPTGDIRLLHDKLVRAAAAGGVLVEVSTAGLRKPVGEIYPSLDLLTAFRAAGVGATLGSDAHAPEEIGYAFDVACDALRSAGYEIVHVPLGLGETRSIPL